MIVCYQYAERRNDATEYKFYIPAQAPGNGQPYMTWELSAGDNPFKIPGRNTIIHDPICAWKIKQS